MAGPGIGFVAIGAVVVLGIAALVGAIILRFAISLANRVLGPRSESSSTTSQPLVDTPAEFQAPSVNSDNPYQSPIHASSREMPLQQAIPEPSFGRAIFIMLSVGILGAAINMLISALVQDAAIGLATPLFSLLLNFLITCGVLTAMLPTSFIRAVLVYLFCMLISVGLFVVIAGVILMIRTVV